MTDTEFKILTTAARLFSEQGFDHTSISEIADAADVGAVTVFRLFKKKESLLRSIFGYGWRQMAPGCNRIAQLEPDPIKALLKITIHIFRYLHQKEPHIERVFLLESRTANKKLEAAIIGKGLDNFHRIIEELIEQGQQDGILRPELNPQAIRQGLIGMGEDLLLGWLWRDIMPDTYRADYTEEDALDVIRCYLEGLRVREKPGIDIDEVRRLYLIGQHLEQARRELFPTNIKNESQWLETVKKHFGQSEAGETIALYKQHKHTLQSMYDVLKLKKAEMHNNDGSET